MTKAKKWDTRGGVTIVGGRPGQRAMRTSDLPIGIEQALTIAAINPGFRADFLRDPVAAAAQRGIQLDEVEAALLRATEPAQLDEMAEQMVIPRSMSRRGFNKSVAASVITMVAGTSFVHCIGACATGADPYDDGGDDTIEEWCQLGGFDCYRFVPGTVASSGEGTFGGLVGLHDEGEDCLANIQRWRSTAGTRELHLISVNWGTTLLTAASLAPEITGIRGDYSSQFGVTLSPAFLAGRGAASPSVFEAVLEREDGWSGGVMLGGVPAGDWIGAPADAMANLVSNLSPPLYYLVGTEDPEYDQAVAFNDAMTGAGATIQFETVTGSLVDTGINVAEFDAIWGWLLANAPS